MSYLTRPAVLISIVIAYTVLTYGIVFADMFTIVLLSGEEMYLDTLGAGFFLVAGGACLTAYLRDRASRRAGGPTSGAAFGYACLALFFFVAFGEEISWGQHLYGFEPPEAVRELNRQNELNIHNLWFLDSQVAGGGRKSGIGLLLNSNRLWDYFVMTIFIALPFLHWRSAAFRRLAGRVQMPIVPPSFALPVLVNYALTAVMVLIFIDHRYITRNVSEIRETSSAFLCLAMALYFLGRAPTCQPRAAGSELHVATTARRDLR